MVHLQVESYMLKKQVECKHIFGEYIAGAGSIFHKIRIRAKTKHPVPAPLHIGNWNWKTALPLPHNMYA
jgi:hypothetical protein